MWRRRDLEDVAAADGGGEVVVERMKTGIWEGDCFEEKVRWDL